jgi:thiol-disulfide isomerase/thioredoxin
MILMKVTSMRICRAIAPSRVASRVVVLLAFCAVFFAQPGTGLIYASSRDSEIMSWSVIDHHGREIRSSSLMGRVTIVNFWATWCIPCIAENMVFNDLMKKYKKDGLTIVSVSIDVHSQAVLHAFAEQFKMNYPVTMTNPEIASAFRVGDTVPLTFMLDQQGRIVRKYVGYTKKEELEKELRPLLKP